MLITPSQAKAQGIPFRHNPPENTICQFCGATLEPQGLLFGDVVILWQPFPPRCTCQEAQAYWEKYDADKKAAEEAEKQAEERKRKQERIDRILGRSGIKKRFRNRSFDNFDTDTPERARCFKIAKRYADTFPERYNSGDGLYIEGTNGTGKTHLAAAIALQLIGEGIPVICKTSSDLLLDIKKTYDSKEIPESRVLDVYKTVDLLIIDDLGKEQCSDWSMSTLYSILNDRYEDMKPTIVTTNYWTDALINALTPRGYDNSKIVAIISRLKETSTVLTMKWADYRTAPPRRRK